MRDFVDRQRMPWARWFMRLLHRRGVRTMAVELVEQGGPDGGDWRAVGATLRSPATGP